MKIILKILLVVVPFIIRAQDSTVTVDDLYIDFSPSNVGAFTLLGITPTNTATPNSPKELLIDIQSFITSGKEIANGIAIEYSPWFTMQRNNDTVAYKKAKYDKIVRRKGLSISLGTAVDSSNARIAYGFKWTPIDKSDILLNDNYIRQVNKLLQKKLETQVNDQFDFQEAEIDPMFSYINDTLNGVFKREFEVDTFLYALLDENGSNLTEYGITSYVSSIEASLISYFNILSINYSLIKNDILLDFNYVIRKMYELQTMYNEDLSHRGSTAKSIAKIKENYEKGAWNNLALSFGAGQILYSDDKSWGSLKANQFSWFVNGSLPLNNFKNILSKKDFLQLTYLIQHTFIGEPDSGNHNHDLKLGGRFIIGNEKARLSTDVMFNYKVIPEFTNEENIVTKFDNEKSLALTIGTEFRIREGLWLEFALGADNVIGNQDAKFLSLGNLKYAFNNKRRKF